jgi:hypothetical protein
VLSFVMLLLSAGVTIIGWAIVICLVLVGVRIVIPVVPFLYGKLWRIRVYDETKSGGLILHSFKAEDFWHLWRMRDTMMIGRSGNKYYFCGGHTPEDARKELEKVAAIRAAQRADEHERRPRWSLSERVELPGFEATYRMVDITFKLFQWLAFAGQGTVDAAVGGSVRTAYSTDPGFLPGARPNPIAPTATGGGRVGGAAGHRLANSASDLCVEKI